MITRIIAATLTGLFLSTTVYADQAAGGTATGKREHAAPQAVSDESDDKAVALEGIDPESESAVRRPMQEVKPLGATRGVEQDRIIQRQDFGQTQQTPRSADRVNGAERDSDEQPTTRENGDDGKSNKSEAARSLRPCPTAPPPASAPANPAGVAADFIN